LESAIKAGGLVKATVGISNQGRRVCIGGSHRRNALQAPFLHQAVLQRQIDTIYAPFGLAGISTDALDIEFKQRRLNYGHALQHSKMIRTERSTNAAKWQ
jgi:hypothetical protein